MLAAYKAQQRIEHAAPATINKELQLVHHAFNLAMREWEWCRENPMHRVSMEPVRNEEDRLLGASSPWLHEIIRFALNTGMRQGEILNLQWQDVDFTRGTLIVMKSKNGTWRTIPLNSTVYELLGHKTGTMTQRYAHHSPESLRDGVNVLDKVRQDRVSTNSAQG